MIGTSGDRRLDVALRVVLVPLLVLPSIAWYSAKNLGARIRRERREKRSTKPVAF